MTERMGLAAVGRQNRQRAALARRAELRPAARRLAAVAVGFAGGWAVVYGALMPLVWALCWALQRTALPPVRRVRRWVCCCTGLARSRCAVSVCCAHWVLQWQRGGWVPEH